MSRAALLAVATLALVGTGWLFGMNQVHKANLRDDVKKAQEQTEIAKEVHHVTDQINQLTDGGLRSALYDRLRSGDD